MTTPEEEKTPSYYDAAKGLVGSIFLAVPKLRPRVEKNGENGRVAFDIDLDHKESGEALDQLDRELYSPRWDGFREAISNGYKRAWYTATFGGLSVIVAAIELGPRHGKDVKHLLDLLEERSRLKQWFQ